MLLQSMQNPNGYGDMSIFLLFTTTEEKGQTLGIVGVHFSFLSCFAPGWWGQGLKMLSLDLLQNSTRDLLFMHTRESTPFDDCC